MAPRSLLALPVFAAIGLVALTGCSATPSAEAPPASPSSAPSESPTPEPSDAPTSQPITIACADLISADVMYSYNPNFGAVDGWEPDAGTRAAKAVDNQGIACRWLNQTGGDTIDVAVASLDDATLEALKNEAFSESTMVPTYGDEAYFAVTDGVGTAIVFNGSYWLIASSDYFLEPGDATEIVEAALSALP